MASQSFELDGVLLKPLLQLKKATRTYNYYSIRNTAPLAVEATTAYGKEMGDYKVTTSQEEESNLV